MWRNPHTGAVSEPRRLADFSDAFRRCLLSIGVFFAAIGAWFAILVSGRYPQGIFRFVEGVSRWGHRVNGYAYTLVTDEYPPFRLRV